MRSLEVSLAERSYPILIGPGLLDRCEALERLATGRQVAIVTDDVVAPRYLARLHGALGNAPAALLDVVLPSGEAHKTWESLNRIFDALLAARFDRGCLLLALGGGVVGDMAGFAAAVYQRGVDFVQLPTTLLAQVDSSVGGKTAINHPAGKNMIGAFHQPRAVVIDIDTLRSLPLRELRAGLAEVVKYGLICDAEFFEWLEGNADRLLALDAPALMHAVHRCCAIKAQIVARDEHEQGDRALLNLGHTFGHAIESVTGYSRWLHGEAVAAGLLMAASMSQRTGLISAAEVARIAALLQRLGLRTDARGELAPAEARAAMSLDKKVKDGRVRLVLMRGIGRAFVTDDYVEETLAATLEAHLS